MNAANAHPDAQMHKSKKNDAAAAEDMDQKINAQVASQMNMQPDSPVIDGNSMMNVPLYLY